jgi:hypothetical protein
MVLKCIKSHAVVCVTTQCTLHSSYSVCITLSLLSVTTVVMVCNKYQIMRGIMFKKRTMRVEIN